jgi:putative ABC transport system permease protein
MLRSFFITAYRNFKNNKVYAITNSIGLAVGMSCCLMITLYVSYEISYDRFFDDSERIYRVALERKYPDRTRMFGSSPVTLAPTLLENYPEVELATRLHKLFFRSDLILTREDNESFTENKFLFADSLFFQVFSFDFLEGDPETALDGHNNIVLTESTARKYFGDDIALDKILTIDTTTLLVTGVIKDVPENSHMDFDLLGSIHSLPFIEAAIEHNSWINPWLYTYIKLRRDTNPEEFQNKLPGMVKEYGLASILSGLGLGKEEYFSSGHDFIYFLQSLADIHLHSNLDIELQPNSDIIYVYLLISVVALILLVSCINFINLATARSIERAKEVGLRKVMGSKRGQLIFQFLTESILINLISIIIAILLCWIFLPVFNTYIEKSLSLNVLLNPLGILGLVFFSIFIGLLAGFYPSIVIASSDITTVIKGKYNTNQKGKFIRNSLIVFQFFVSMLMLSGTLMLEKQMSFVRKKNLGFNKENILVLRNTQALDQDFNAFKNEVRQLSGVVNVASAFGLPGEFLGSNIFTPDDPEVSQLRANISIVDEHFIPTMGMEIVSGRNFDQEFNDTLSILINESAARTLNFEEPLKHRLFSGGRDQDPGSEIVGIVRDYHFKTLHYDISPLIIRYAAEGFNPDIMIIRIQPGDPSTRISQIDSLWSQFVPEEKINFSFLDQDLDELYRSEQTSGKIFSSFTIVAMIMACFGLFGLTAYVIQQRMKEIGVRKVLGASVMNILILLNWNITRLVILAFLFSIPVAYYGIEQWLDSFAYRTSINWSIFVQAGIITILVAWGTISYQSIKIALRNPIDSIRDE